ncbi:MAG: hypothetical protein K9G36_01770 [Crocinitomicaceae bacterium]|nr:hypothetical protein [Crocinitomicaceae bacterium]MCF8444872.1 hypothetical protein [Crocinitomicaceae bacterium]
MSELRNLYLVKEKVIQIKFELAKNRVEIYDLLRDQNYEKAAEERDRTSKLLNSLIDQKQLLIEHQSVLSKSVAHLEEQSVIMDILYEMNAFEQNRKEFREYQKEFIESMKKEFDFLMLFKKELRKDNRFDTAKLIQEEILLIGDFLLKANKI